jgi:opacity protein-like surface antigen
MSRTRPLLRARRSIRRTTRIDLRALALLGALLQGLLGVLSPALADANAEDEAGEPGFFVLGPQEVGFALGYGHGVDFAGSGVVEAHEIREIVLLPHWQLLFTRAPTTPAWYKGRVGFRVEPTIYLAVEPHAGTAFGVTFLFRYQFKGWGRFSPYFQIGAGPLGLWLDVADQDDGLAFNPQGAIGLSTRVTETLSLDLGWRYVHVSNAYTHSPNGGFDSMHIMLGFAHHF